MRNEKEMMDLILTTAKNDERVRAVIMNGSRTNPHAKKDIFQDYDIEYIVSDINSFTSDHRWVDIFGERMMMQMPEENVLPPAENDGRFPYLMQFKDGNRLDLTLIPIEKMDQLMNFDSLSLVLLDKDEMIDPLPLPNDRDYHIKPPSEKEFMDSCNEFWWICLNISKGLWREELTYAMFMYEQVNRNVLIRMIEWYIGMKTNFTKSAGKHGKYIQDYLETELWNEFVRTYPDADYENIWQSLFHMCDLFRKIAVKVANHFAFRYPYDEDKNVSAYLQHVKNLPGNSDG
ncbi:aminoglycoside 6-adenylyltransferase [Melghirimyces algeriensis]|uniref:Aminoglycoside 6-adenylyltransferase n=1 Tax=Melghirimyces algeriensis TaxID=910412 RepID=A0A521FK14_9BACL|nr:aminoglycoside 6-adenylyltransferase [Melghirimyces algeriensis]SMO95940.1 aminoglycoside 6-adenylyltransferase [Melghirimyces algeriensis]